jgi:hypothetical protein
MRNCLNFIGGANPVDRTPPDSSRNFAMVLLAYPVAFAKPIRRLSVRFCRRSMAGYGKSATFRPRSRANMKPGESKGAIE